MQNGTKHKQGAEHPGGFGRQLTGHKWPVPNRKSANLFYFQCFLCRNLRGITHYGQEEGQ
jgi:hypothetical protein